MAAPVANARGPGAAAAGAAGPAAAGASSTPAAAGAHNWAKDIREKFYELKAAVGTGHALPQTMAAMGQLEAALTFELPVVRKRLAYSKKTKYWPMQKNT